MLNRFQSRDDETTMVDISCMLDITTTIFDTTMYNVTVVDLLTTMLAISCDEHSSSSKLIES